MSDRHSPPRSIANWIGAQRQSIVKAVLVLAAFVGGIALIGVAQRAGWIQNAAGTGSSVAGDGSQSETVYTCSMHPQIRQSGPGSCPICGMKLVPATNVPSPGVSVTIEPAARRLAGIQTDKAKSGPVLQTIRTIGSIEYDESELATIAAYVNGRIEKLYANYVGVPVKMNDDLALIYSPDLYSAQVEYLTALKGSGLSRLGGTSNLLELAKQNLIELGLTEDQVADLQRRGQAESRIRIRSPIDGTVIEKRAVEGDYIKTGDPIYRIANLATVWLMLDLYPDDAARIRFGQQVEAEVQSIPGEVFTGRVAFIDPRVSTKTRSVRVRVEMLNPDNKLRPGDFATARVYVQAIRSDKIYDPVLAGKYISPMHPQIIQEEPGGCPICGMELIPTSELGFSSVPLPEQQIVTVPRSAVLMTGDTSVVYVETDPGRFEIRRVTTGPMNEDEVVILQGIAAGEVVATSGNFLIDSQMQLAGNPSLIDPRGAPSYPDGPLQLAATKPTVLDGHTGQQLDRVLKSYVNIQKSLAADHAPVAADVVELTEALKVLESDENVPSQAQGDLQRAAGAAQRLDGPIEQARLAFRPVSHALLRVATHVRGPETAEQLKHMFCPMVPGGGGDWMQFDKDLRNPYWGSEMLTCGETIPWADAQPGPDR